MILNKFFGKNSKFSQETNSRRKLILSSSTIAGVSLSGMHDLSNSDIKNLTVNYQKYLTGLSSQFENSFDVITSQRFMSLKDHIQGIRIKMVSVGNGRFERRLKYLLDNMEGYVLICCNEQNLKKLKSQFEKKNIRYSCVDESK